MGDIRGVLGWAFAGVGTCVFLLLTAPAGHAAGPSSGMQAPPDAEPSPLPGEQLLPTLTLGPATTSAGALVTVVGEGFAGCVAADGKVKASRSGDVSLAATGDVSLRWDGIDPVTIIHLDEKLGLSAVLERGSSAPPGDHRLVSRCADDGEGMGAADVTVPPSLEGMAVTPGSSPVDNPVGGDAVDGIAPSPTTSAVDAALVVPDNPDGPSTAENPSTPFDFPIPAENEDNRAIGAEPTLSDTTSMSWGLLIGTLILVGAALAALSSIPFVLQSRRGPKWVGANVRAVAGVTPTASVELAPNIDDYWPPIPVLRFALHADSGTQVLTEVEQ